MTMQQQIIDALASALVAYRTGEPRGAVHMLREIADKIEKESDAYDAYRFDADGLADHQRARAEP